MTDKQHASPMWAESYLSELLEFVRGEGRFAVLGPGITTYGNTNGIAQRNLHNAMLELETRGLVYRRDDDVKSTRWMPVVDQGAKQ